VNTRTVAEAIERVRRFDVLYPGLKPGNVSIGENGVDHATAFGRSRSSTPATRSAPTKTPGRSPASPAARHQRRSRWTR